MRIHRFLIAIAAALIGFAWTAPAMAYGHFAHARFGVYIGPGWGPWYGGPWPYYYGAYGPYGGYPYYYPGYAAPAAPVQYVEQGQARVAPDQSSWYYCADPQGYYPYVQQCRTSWQRVSPTPPGMQ